MIFQSLCVLFGHRAPFRFQWGRRPVTGEYLTVPHSPLIDGTGRTHFDVYGECPRCGTVYRVGKMHGHQITRWVKQEQPHD